MAFKEDTKLDICLPKLYIQGLSLDDTREEVHKTVEADAALFGLKDIISIHDDPAKNVVQVDGMVCVGVPIGSPEFVQAFVAEKLQLLNDPGVSFKLELDSVTTRVFRTSTAPCHRQQWQIRPAGYKRWIMPWSMRCSPKAQTTALSCGRARP